MCFDCKEFVAVVQQSRKKKAAFSMFRNMTCPRWKCQHNKCYFFNKNTQIIILLTNRYYTSIKSSSAPLKRKIIGRGGIQPDSTVTLANSSIDAAKQ
jgi:hypothetical protein